MHVLSSTAIGDPTYKISSNRPSPKYYTTFNEVHYPAQDAARRRRRRESLREATLRAALNHRWNSGYVDCFEYLKKMLPLPAAIVEQRLSIFMIYANAILSAHEAALEKRHARSSRLWGQPFTIENMLNTLEAALTCPPSKQTQAKLPETGKKPAR